MEIILERKQNKDNITSANMMLNPMDNVEHENVLHQLKRQRPCTQWWSQEN